MYLSKFEDVFLKIPETILSGKQIKTTYAGNHLVRKERVDNKDVYITKLKFSD